MNLGLLGINVGTILAKKAALNAAREDHKPETRAKAGLMKFLPCERYLFFF